MLGTGTTDGSQPIDSDMVDWARLRAAAREAASHARAPYSGLHVGAAALTRSGDIVSGCNVENASYGMTLCAECGLASQATLQDARLVALSVQTNDGRLLTPCGRCRQVLSEIGGPDLLVDADPEPARIRELLPGAFDDSQLPGRSP